MIISAYLSYYNENKVNVANEEQTGGMERSVSYMRKWPPRRLSARVRGSPDTLLLMYRSVRGNGP